MNITSRFFRKVPLREREVQLILAASLPNSKVEVPCASGRIDILTPEQVIEVKHVRNYKHALGQVLSYIQYFPNKKPRLHLFDEAKIDAAFRQQILDECQRFNVSVTFAEEQ